MGKNNQKYQVAVPGLRPVHVQGLNADQPFFLWHAEPYANGAQALATGDSAALYALLTHNERARGREQGVPKCDQTNFCVYSAVFRFSNTGLEVAVGDAGSEEQTTPDLVVTVNKISRDLVTSVTEADILWATKAFRTRKVQGKDPDYNDDNSVAGTYGVRVAEFILDGRKSRNYAAVLRGGEVLKVGNLAELNEDYTTIDVRTRLAEVGANYLVGQALGIVGITPKIYLHPTMDLSNGTSHVTQPSGVIPFRRLNDVTRLAAALSGIDGVEITLGEGLSETAVGHAKAVLSDPHRRRQQTPGRQGGNRRPRNRGGRDGPPVRRSPKRSGASRQSRGGGSPSRSGGSGGRRSDGRRSKERSWERR